MEMSEIVQEPKAVRLVFEDREVEIPWVQISVVAKRHLQALYDGSSMPGQERDLVEFTPSLVEVTHVGAQARA